MLFTIRITCYSRKGRLTSTSVFFCISVSAIWGNIVGRKSLNKCRHLTQIATRLFVFSLRSMLHKRHSTICAGATGVMWRLVDSSIFWGASVIVVFGSASSWGQVRCARGTGVGCGSWFHLMAGRVSLCLLSLFLVLSFWGVLSRASAKRSSSNIPLFW